MQNILLIGASTITLASVIPYIRDILKGTTKPNIVSWVTWTLLTAIATAAEYSVHEYTVAIYTASAAVTTAMIVFLGFKYGYARYTSFDIICQISALIGFALWWIFNNPALAVIASVTIDLVAALPTIRHAWIDPSEETSLTYAMCSMGECWQFLR